MPALTRKVLSLENELEKVKMENKVKSLEELKESMNKKTLITQERKVMIMMVKRIKKRSSLVVTNVCTSVKMKTLLRSTKL